MKSTLLLDLKKLKSRAFDIAEWSEETIRRYHAVIPSLKKEDAHRLNSLYEWMFVPPTLWPFNVHALCSHGSGLYFSCRPYLGLRFLRANERFHSHASERHGYEHPRMKTMNQSPRSNSQIVRHMKTPSNE